MVYIGLTIALQIRRKIFNTLQPMGEILKAYFNIFIYRKTTMENSDLLGPPPRLGLELGTS